MKALISRNYALECIGDFLCGHALPTVLRPLEAELEEVRQRYANEESNAKALEFIDENILINEWDGAEADELLFEVARSFGYKDEELDHLRLGAVSSFVEMELLISTSENIPNQCGFASFEEWEEERVSLDNTFEFAVGIDSHKTIVFTAKFYEYVGEEAPIQIIGIETL